MSQAADDELATHALAIEVPDAYRLATTLAAAFDKAERDRAIKRRRIGARRPALSFSRLGRIAAQKMRAYRE
jgi:hypothetical protein